MAPIVNINILATYTNVNPRQIHPILALFRATRQVTKAIDPQRLGRWRQLTPNDVAVRILKSSSVYLMTSFQYLHGSLSRNCDGYLDELRAGLAAMCGIHVSISSVWRALRRSGYTMKKVCMYCYISNSTDSVPCSSRSQRSSAVRKSALRTYIKLVFATRQISLYLSTRAYVIIVHVIVVVRGLFKGRERYGRPFL